MKMNKKENEVMLTVGGFCFTFKKHLPDESGKDSAERIQKQINIALKQFPLFTKYAVEY